MEQLDKELQEAIAEFPDVENMSAEQLDQLLQQLEDEEEWEDDDDEDYCEDCFELLEDCTCDLDDEDSWPEDWAEIDSFPDDKDWT